MFFVYVLYSQLISKYYVGYTNDFERRFYEHNSKQTKYSSTGIPWTLVYKVEMETHSASMILEAKILKRGILRHMKNIGVV